MTYGEVIPRIDALVRGETDPVALMATIACELYHAFEYFDWVGFYRNIGDDTLKIGPYQGVHGCLTIPFSRGVCGQCALTRTPQIAPDVSRLDYHIACSSTTQSEIVVPVFSAGDDLVAVLDIDSDQLDMFDTEDELQLQEIVSVFRMID